MNRKVMHKLQTKSAAQMKRLAGFLAKEIVKNKRLKIQHALVLALSGDLGAGKTTFAQGFLRALGVKGKITSPTFILFQRFKLQSSGFTNAYHVDCYRIENANELIKLGIKKILRDPNNLVLIEWPEKIKKLFHQDTLWWKFEHGEKSHERTMRITTG